MLILRKYTSFFTSIILLLLIVNLKNAESDFEDLRLIKEFAKTWNFSKDATYTNSLLAGMPKEYNTIGYMNDGFGCQQPGYTGQYCEFPICETPNNKHFDHDNAAVLVDFIHQPSCSKNALFFVDISMFSFTIEVQAPGNNQHDISVYNRNGTLMNPVSTDTTDPTRKIYVYSPQNPGVYRIVPSTRTPELGCLIYVLATAHSYVNIGFVPSSQYDLIPSERNDFPNQNPYLHQHNTIVAHTTNVRKPGGITALSIFEGYNIMSRPHKFSIRYNCEFDYYYNSLFCLNEDQYFIKIEGYDFSGNSFSRIKSFSCIVNPNTSTAPPPTTMAPAPPPTTTAPPETSTAKANIYLITDVSASVPASMYADTLTNFLMEIFNNFKIDPEYVNVAFSPSPGDDDIWFILPVFNAFFSSETLRKSIYSSYYPIMGEQSPGQKQLSQVIGRALDSSFLTTGYNPSYKPHWLIYVTTTSSPDSYAIKAAQKVRESGVFKIVTIAYNPANNIQALLMMSDCFYPISHQEQLSAIATALAAKINFASSKGQDGPC
uniref:VWFA domain-containing protein n=1 Tax=Strongyloides papillosus TaxID=174720 RepID=A0A0N5BQT3_STREA